MKMTILTFWIVFLSGCSVVNTQAFETAFFAFELERDTTDRTVLTVTLDIHESDVGDVFGSARFSDDTNMNIAEVRLPMANEAGRLIDIVFTDPATDAPAVCVDFNYVGFNDHDDEDFFEFVGCLE